MKSLWRYAAFVVTVFVVTLIAKLPAQFVYQQFDNHLLPVKLYGLQGSVWSGKAEQISLANYSVNNLQWQLSPWALLTGDLNIDWQFNDPLGQTSGELLSDGDVIRITVVNADLDMAGLADLFVTLPVRIDGRLRAENVSLTFSTEGITNAGGSLSWQHAGISSPSLIEFGGFTAKLAVKDRVFKADIVDNGGAVELDGLFSLLPEYRYNYEVKIAIRDATEPGLVEGLVVLGKPDEAGRVNLRGSGYL